MNFTVSIDIDAIEYVNSLDDKSIQIIKTHLRTLEYDPFPGKGGDKELLNLRQDVKIFRLHIGRSFTAYYEIPLPKFMGFSAFPTAIKRQITIQDDLYSNTTGKTSYSAVTGLDLEA